MENKEYIAKVVFASRELSAIEKISFKNFNDCLKIDTELKDKDSFDLNLNTVVVFDIHNERSKSDTYYRTILMVTDDGVKYTSSSNSLIREMLDIFDELCDGGIGINEVTTTIIKKPSNNYKDKFFFTCTVR